VSEVPLIVTTRSSGPPASQPVIKEMPGSVASGTSYIFLHFIKQIFEMGELGVFCETETELDGFNFFFAST